MTEDEFDDLVDNATHAVNNLVPDFILAGMDAEDRSGLLIRINDALSPVLRGLIPPRDDGGETLRLSTMAAFVSELIETHMEKCESAGDGPEERLPHIVSDIHGTRANIASIATRSTDDDAYIYFVLDEGDAFQVDITRVDGL